MASVSVLQLRRGRGGVPVLILYPRSAFDTMLDTS